MLKERFVVRVRSPVWMSGTMKYAAILIPVECTVNKGEKTLSKVDTNLKIEMLLYVHLPLLGRLYHAMSFHG